MVETCGLQCVKYLLFVFNIIFWLAGGAVLGIGIWIRLDVEKFLPLIGNDLYLIAAYVLIGAGGLVFLVGFSGCCGAIKESKCLLWTYFALLFLIFAIEVAAAILAFVFFDEVNAYVNKQINETLSDYGKEDSKLLSRTVDLLQTELECCGSNSWRDWKTWNSTNVPSSCCKEYNYDNDKCTKGSTRVIYNVNSDPTDIHSKGCVPALEQWGRKNLIILGAVGIGTAFIELLGMIFACCLIKAIDDQN